MTSVKLNYSNMDIENEKTTYDFQLTNGDDYPSSFFSVIVDEEIAVSAIDNMLYVAWNKLYNTLDNCIGIVEKCIDVNNKKKSVPFSKVASISLSNLMDEEYIYFRIEFLFHNKNNYEAIVFVKLPKDEIVSGEKMYNDGLTSALELLESWKENARHRLYGSGAGFGRYFANT